jgi:hypothetical protein
MEIQSYYIWIKFNDRPIAEEFAKVREIFTFDHCFLLCFEDGKKIYFDRSNIERITCIPTHLVGELEGVELK